MPSGARAQARAGQRILGATTPPAPGEWRQHGRVSRRTVRDAVLHRDRIGTALAFSHRQGPSRGAEPAGRSLDGRRNGLPARSPLVWPGPTRPSTAAERPAPPTRDQRTPASSPPLPTRRAASRRFARSSILTRTRLGAPTAPGSTTRPALSQNTPQDGPLRRRYWTRVLNRSRPTTADSATWSQERSI